MVDTKPKSSAVDRLLGRSANVFESEIDDCDVRNAYDEVRTPKARSREGITLDVRKADGQCYGMSYAYLTRIDYEPGDRLKLHFASDVVQIEGRGLKGLYRRLLDHRVEAIQEGTDAEEGLKPEDSAHIERLELINRKEADHDD